MLTLMSPGAWATTAAARGGRRGVLRGARERCDTPLRPPPGHAGMDSAAARRVGVLAGQLCADPQLMRGACASNRKRSSMFEGQVVLITGAAKVRSHRLGQAARWTACRRRRAAGAAPRPAVHSKHAPPTLPLAPRNGKGRAVGVNPSPPAPCQGIGEAAALMFADHGASGLVLSDLDATALTATAAAARARGAAVEEVAGDVTKDETIAQLVAAARRLGGLHVLVNNAGARPTARRVRCASRPPAAQLSWPRTRHVTPAPTLTPNLQPPTLPPNPTKASPGTASSTRSRPSSGPRCWTCT